MIIKNTTNIGNAQDNKIKGMNTGKETAQMKKHEASLSSSSKHEDGPDPNQNGVSFLGGRTIHAGKPL